MENFIYSIPTDIYFGKGQIRHLPKIITKYGKRVLLVYGGGSIKRNGIYDTICDLLKKEGIAFWELSGVEPNPRITSVRKGVDICRQYDIEVVVPVGGGSAIDCAKAVASAVSYEGDAYRSFSHRKCFAGHYGLDTDSHRKRDGTFCGYFQYGYKR